MPIFIKLHIATGRRSLFISIRVLTIYSPPRSVNSYGSVSFYTSMSICFCVYHNKFPLCLCYRGGCSHQYRTGCCPNEFWPNLKLKLAANETIEGSDAMCQRNLLHPHLKLAEKLIIRGPARRRGPRQAASALDWTVAADVQM